MQGYSALLYAISVNNHSAVNQLIEREILLETCSQRTAIMVAAQTGRVDMLKFLINRFPQLLKRQDALGRTALRCAFDALDDI